MLLAGIVVRGFGHTVNIFHLRRVRSSNLSALLVVVSGGLLAYADTIQSGGYDVTEIPSVVIALIGQLLP